jgi:hypothetical protein
MRLATVEHKVSDLQTVIDALGGNVLNRATELANFQTTFYNTQNQLTNIPPYSTVPGYNFYDMSNQLQVKLNLYSLLQINNGPNFLVFNFYNITGNMGNNSGVGVWPPILPQPKYYFIIYNNISGGIVQSFQRLAEYRLSLVRDPNTSNLQGFQLYLAAVFVDKKADKLHS